MLIGLTPNLTHDADNTPRGIGQTHAGMASWASPDVSAECRECVFFQHATERRLADGRLGSARCGKYRQLMRKDGPKIPPHANACRFFDPSPAPPAAYLPKMKV